MDLVNFDRLTPPVARHFGRSLHTPRALYVGIESLATSNAATTPESSIERTPRDNTLGSISRKRKVVGTDSLVDFVKEFNYEYLARAETQNKNKRVWRTEVLALDMVREVKIAQNEAQIVNMDQFFYELKVEKTKNLGT